MGSVDIKRLALVSFMISALLIISFSHITLELSSGQIFEVYSYQLNIIIKSNGNFSSDIFNEIYTFQNETTSYSHQYAIIKGVIVNFKNRTYSQYSLVRDEDNNTFIVVNGLPKYIKAYEVNISLNIEIFLNRVPPPEISLEKSGGLNDIPQELRIKYSNYNDAWVNDSSITKLAISMLNKSNVLDTLLKYSSWIDENILYPENPSHLGPWNATRVLAEGEGDCDDRAILLIAMARSVGIPAYLQVGAIYLSNYTFSEKRERIFYKTFNAGWHGWVMAYVPPWGWLPVDLTFFRNADISFLFKENRTYVKLRAKDPIDHVINSAVYTRPVLIVGSISSINYIEPFNKWLNSLYEYNLNWSEIHKLNYKGKMTYTIPTPELMKSKTIIYKNDSMTPKALTEDFKELTKGSINTTFIKASPLYINQVIMIIIMTIIIIFLIILLSKKRALANQTL